MPRLSTVTRRAALIGAGAIAATSTLPAVAKAPFGGPIRTTVRRFRLGAFEITTISDGLRNGGGLHPVFGGNTTAEEVAALVTANNLPPASSTFYFTPTVVNTGDQVVLFDTGNGARGRPDVGNTRARLADTGIAPEDVDVVVLTHMHPDHIGGMTEDGEAAFPNARYVTGAAEYDFWSADDRLSGPMQGNAQLVRANVVPFADRMTFVDPGQALVPGIEAVDARGHTPGHLAFHIESEGRRLMITADTANHFVVALQRPDWHLRFDADKEMAAQARRRVFGMIAADRIPFIGYHMPSPSIGFVEARGDGFVYVPETYQFNL